MKLPNLFIVDLDSVNYLTFEKAYKYFPSPFRSKVLPNAYAVNNAGSGYSTIAFLIEVLGTTDNLLDPIREQCEIQKKPSKDFFKTLKSLGYNTIFASEWPYHFSENSRKNTSFFTRWLFNNFDIYVDTNPDLNGPYDFGRLLALTEHSLPPEPWVIVAQIHDTHLWFDSVGVNNWYYWGDDLANLVGEDILKLNSLFTKGELKWDDFPNKEEIFSLFKKVRSFQHQAIKHCMNVCKNFVDKQQNLVYHIIGDHPTFLGEVDHFGNPGGFLINLETHKEHLRTIWITNQDLDPKKEYFVRDIPFLLKELLLEYIYL